jgi:hypothetical protein
MPDSNSDFWRFDGTGFQGVASMLGDIGNAITEAMTIVRGTRDPSYRWFMENGVPPDFGDNYNLVLGDVETMVRQLQQLVTSDQFAVALTAHGLADGSAQWEFKRAIVEQEFLELEDARRDMANKKRGWWRKMLSRLRNFLHVGNIILRSVASALAPNPVGSALDEIKGFTEHLLSARLSTRKRQ